MGSNLLNDKSALDITAAGLTQLQGCRAMISVLQSNLMLLHQECLIRDKEF